ncbi:sigma-70 family RNA polymerase sigma factor [Teredinibacter franksiae]|uniref:sigma-70 family RNA polymerase sigma factor n=1 Tax=Teredinibacter franksiae TaxID=2761453 RepID=UPI001625BF82|nr:sigma-70 family RNA polymerase sigma factor [Teredinibacter franksiae]
MTVLQSQISGEAKEPQLWQIFELERSIDARNIIFEYYSLWSRKVASKLYSKYACAGLEWADFSQFCALGLLMAIERFDLSKGTPFKAFAYPYMVGRTLDGLQCFFNERVRHGRDHRGAERLESIAIQDTAFESVVDAVVGLAFGFFLESGVVQDELPNNSVQDSFFQAETLACIKNIVSSLDDPERGVLKAHYFQNMKFADIAAMLRVTPSRVSQIHSKGIKAVRLIYEQIYDA